VVTTELITGKVWPAIHAAAEKARGRKLAAVAYIGEDGAELLSDFAEGDVLVCNMGPGALQAGATHPDAIAKLIRRGVHVYSHPSLHAKVYALGTVAIVGSANVSNNAANRLVEVVTRTTDPTLVADTRRFIRSTCRDSMPIDSAYLREARKAYRRPRGGANSGKPARADKPSVRVHVEDFVGSDPPALVEKHYRANVDDWQAKAGPPSKWSADFSWDNNRRWLRDNDWVLWVYVGGKSPEVLPPMQVLCRLPAGGRSAQIVTWYRAANKRPLSWSHLYSRVLTNANYKLEYGQTVKSPAAVESIFALWKIEARA